MFDSTNTHHQNDKPNDNFAHSHPYEYLTKLNTLYNNFNRSTTKDYSSASKIKLPFKKFNTIKVPEWFEASYAKEKKELIQYSSAQDPTIDDSEKKLWKEHREIIRKYLEHKHTRKTAPSPSKNKDFVQKLLTKDRSNIFLKKIIEKGTKFEYDQKKLEEQVLNKLRKLNKSNAGKTLSRCQTAKVTNQIKAQRLEEKQQEEKLSERDFLEFNRESDLILKYKGLIKQADCSISDKNIKKTANLLKYMQSIVDNIE